jgi:type IV pilus assembly protein PilF
MNAGANQKVRCSGWAAFLSSGRKALSLLAAMALLSSCVTTSKPTEDAGEARKAAVTNTSLGRNYMDRGQYEVALEKLKRALAHDSTYAPAHTMLAVLYETIGDMESAEKHYQEAVKYDPDDGSVNNNYARFLCTSGKFNEAQSHFRAAFDDPFYQTPEVAYANAGICAMDDGDLDKAEQFLRQSLEFDANFGTALLPLADISYRNGAYLRARGFMQRFEVASIQNEDSLFLGYRIESALGDDRSAQNYVQALRKDFPKSQSLITIGQEQ